MRLVVTRVNSASVEVDDEVCGAINKGALVLVGIHEDDTEEDMKWCAKKLSTLRLWDDDTGKGWAISLTNHPKVTDEDIGILLVSQFTLFARTKKPKPDFSKAMKGDLAENFFNTFCKEVEVLTKKSVSTGKFGAEMKVKSENDGPVTIVLDSKLRE